MTITEIPRNAFALYAFVIVGVLGLLVWLVKQSVYAQREAVKAQRDTATQLNNHSTEILAALIANTKVLTSLSESVELIRDKLLDKLMGTSDEKRSG